MIVGDFFFCHANCILGTVLFTLKTVLSFLKLFTFWLWDLIFLPYHVYSFSVSFSKDIYIFFFFFTSSQSLILVMSQPWTLLSSLFILIVIVLNTIYVLVTPRFTYLTPISLLSYGLKYSTTCSEPPFGCLI